MSIFAKIIRKELPSEIIYENDHVIVIKDINPVAPIHLLIITKKEISSIQEIQKEDLHLISEVALAAQHLARVHNIKDYRLLTNCGKEAGQTIFHLHFHFISGRSLGTMA